MISDISELLWHHSCYHVFIFKLVIFLLHIKTVESRGVTVDPRCLVPTSLYLYTSTSDPNIRREYSTRTRQGLSSGAILAGRLWITLWILQTNKETSDYIQRCCWCSCQTTPSEEAVASVKQLLSVERLPERFAPTSWSFWAQRFGIHRMSMTETVLFSTSVEKNPNLTFVLHHC